MTNNDIQRIWKIIFVENVKFFSGNIYFEMQYQSQIKLLSERHILSMCFDKLKLPSEPSTREQQKNVQQNQRRNVICVRQKM